MPYCPQDWNTFLLKFNNLDFCISENETLKHLLNDSTPPESTVTTGQARSSTQTPQALEDTGPINISVAVTLTLDPLKPFGGYSRNITHLSSTVFGHQIGLSGIQKIYYLLKIKKKKKFFARLLPVFMTAKMWSVLPVKCSCQGLWTIKCCG